MGRMNLCRRQLQTLERAFQVSLRHEELEKPKNAIGVGAVREVGRGQGYNPGRKRMKKAGLEHESWKA